MRRTDLLALALSSATLLTGGLLAGCGVQTSPVPLQALIRVDNLGLSDGLSATEIVGGLNNPAGVAFSPDGELTVCTAGPGRDNGNGRVLVVRDGEAVDHITGFATEYWKVGADGAPDRFKLGPLNAAWLEDGRLVVSNGGLTDGSDNLLFFDGPGTAADGTATNGIAPTSDDAMDKGEGNLTGFSQSVGGSRLFVCGQGADAKSWLLSCDVEDLTLTTFASADEHGIATNSPMQALAQADGSVLVLYSGAGGTEDGLIVRWSAEGTPVDQWTLPGISDPMGMATIPGSDALAVVDNNWNLTEVRDGTLARVLLPAGGGDASVRVLATALKGPTACTFGPDGQLYIAQLGPKFDEGQGNVVAIDGIE